MSGAPKFSKREVARAGRYLAENLLTARAADRGFKVDPGAPADDRARGAIEWWRSEHVEPMLSVYDTVASAAPPLDVDGEVDIGGVRAVVENQDDIDELHERLAQLLDVRRVRDWARAPRDTGYRAVHLHVREAGRMIEVQLRTFGQDAWANVVEEESRLSDVNYKAGVGAPQALEFFKLIADMYAVIELGETHPDAAERLYALYPEVKPLFHMPLLQTFDQ